MIKRCLRYQVDFLFGDGNTAVNRFRASGQASHFDRLNALIPSLVREAFSSLHVGLELWQRVGIYTVECETAPNSQQRNIVAGTDCMTGYVFSWGKTLAHKVRRQEISTTIDSLRQQEKFPAENEPLTEHERDLLIITDPAEIGYMEMLDEFVVKVSEFGKNITTRDLFLQDGDGASHRPIMCAIREREFMNKRKDRKSGKYNPMFSLMKKLEAVAIPALLTRSDLLPGVQAQDVASATCVNATDEQEASDASAFFFFMFMSFLFGVIIGCFMPWIIFKVKTAWAKPRCRIAQPLLLDASDGWGTTVSSSSSSNDGRTSPAYDPFYTAPPEVVAQWLAAEGLPHDEAAPAANFNGPAENLFDRGQPLGPLSEEESLRRAHRVSYFRDQYIARLTNDELDQWDEPPEIILDGVDVRELPNFQEVMRRPRTTDLNAADFPPPEDPGRSTSPELLDIPDPDESEEARDASAAQPAEDDDFWMDAGNGGRINRIDPPPICTNPGCSRHSNPPHTTCCRYCGETYSHSNECNERNHLPPLPPRTERVRVRHTATRVYPDPIWTLPRGEKYHFNPNCRFFSQASRSSHGRSFQACAICSTEPVYVTSETTREETVEQ